MTNTRPLESATSPRLGELFLPTLAKLASVQPGERVLDLGARDGDAILAAARRAGEQGQQLALDSDSVRLESVLEHARAEGLHWLQAEINDGSRLPGPDSYWDVVLGHLSFPYLDDPEQTLRETYRVLRPVGRIAVTIFGQRDRCPLITIFLDAITPFVSAAKTVDRSTFRYSDVGKLANTLAEAGFEDAVPERLTEWPAFAGVDEYWTVMAGDNRFSHLVAGLDAEQIAAAKATIEAKSRFYRRRTGIELKVEGVIIAAVK